MLTERVATWVSDHATEPQFSEETQALIDQYAPPMPLARRAQYQELALVLAHSLILLPFGLAIAFTGEISTRLGVHGATGVLYRIAVAGVTWCCVGLGLHVWRFCDASLAIFRSRRDPAHAGGDWRWPRASSDRDFVVQAVAAAVAVVLA